MYMYASVCVCVCVCVCLCVCVCVRARGFRTGWYQKGQTHWKQRRRLQSSLTNILKRHCPSTITIQKTLCRILWRICAAHGNGAGGRRAKALVQLLYKCHYVENFGEFVPPMATAPGGGVRKLRRSVWSAVKRCSELFCGVSSLSCSSRRARRRFTCRQQGTYVCVYV